MCKGKIGQKLILGFVSVTLLVGVVGYISVNASQKALRKTIGEISYRSLAPEMPEHIDKCIYSRIETFQEYSGDLSLIINGTTDAKRQ